MSTSFSFVTLYCSVVQKCQDIAYLRKSTSLGETVFVSGLYIPSKGRNTVLQKIM